MCCLRQSEQKWRFSGCSWHRHPWPVVTWIIRGSSRLCYRCRVVTCSKHILLLYCPSVLIWGQAISNFASLLCTTKNDLIYDVHGKSASQKHVTTPIISVWTEEYSGLKITCWLFCGSIYHWNWTQLKVFVCISETKF